MYSEYAKDLKALVSAEHLTFKSTPSYQEILEHVSLHDGRAYLDLCRNELLMSHDDIVAFARLNDALGAPVLYDVRGITCSPTSLRYVYHAHLVLKHIRDTMPVAQHDCLSLIEVGGGYGGLCLALHYYAAKFGIRFKEYHIVDLAEAGALQERYLRSDAFADCLRGADIRFHDALSSGSTVPCESAFLVSNYAFSEFSEKVRAGYMDALFGKVAHGFMAWNFIPVFDFGKPLIKVEHERPLTCHANRFVYF